MIESTMTVSVRLGASALMNLSDSHGNNKHVTDWCSRADPDIQVVSGLSVLNCQVFTGYCIVAAITGREGLVIYSNHRHTISRL